MNLEKHIELLDIGSGSYEELKKLQHRFNQERADGKRGDALICAQVHPVIDFGHNPARNRFSKLGIDYIKRHHDIDIEEINETITNYKSYKPSSTIEDAEDFLIQMGLIQNGTLTNACMVLFAKKPTRFIPQSRIIVTVYPSNKTGDHFLNDKIFFYNPTWNP